MYARALFFPSAIQTTVLNLSFLSENRHFNRHWNMSHISRLHKINSLLPGARPYSHAYTQLWGGGDDQQPPLSSSIMERYFSWTSLSPTAAEMRLIWSTWLISMVFPLFMHNITIFTGIVIGKQCVFCYVHVWSFLSKTNWDQQDAFNVCLCPLFRRHVLVSLVAYGFYSNREVTTNVISIICVRSNANQQIWFVCCVPHYLCFT